MASARPLTHYWREAAWAFGSASAVRTLRASREPCGMSPSRPRAGRSPGLRVNARHRLPGHVRPVAVGGGLAAHSCGGSHGL